MVCKLWLISLHKIVRIRILMNQIIPAIIKHDNVGRKANYSLRFSWKIIHVLWGSANAPVLKSPGKPKLSRSKQEQWLKRWSNMLMSNKQETTSRKQRNYSHTWIGEHPAQATVSEIRWTSWAAVAEENEGKMVTLLQKLQVMLIFKVPVSSSLSSRW